MSIIAKLSKKPTPPAYAEALNQFPAATVAEHLGITFSYVKMILSGNRKPSPELHQRFVDLADAVRAELAQAS